MQLFYKDNHFVNRSDFIPSPNKVQENIRSLLKRFYRKTIDLSLEIEIISGINLNSKNYKIGDFFFKTLRADQGIERAIYFPQIANALKKNGLPTATFLQNDEGELISKDMYTFGEEIYFFLQPFISGHFYTGTKEEFETAIQMLEKVSNALAEIQPTNAHRIPYGVWNPDQSLAEVKLIISEKKNFDALDAFDNKLLPYLDDCEEIAKFYRENRKAFNISNLHHYDLHPHNVLFDGSKLVAILDLDNIGAIERKVATAFNLYKLGRKSISTGNISVKEFKQIASTHFDLPSMKMFAKVELLQRFTLLFKAHYIRKMDSWDADLKKYICGISEMDLIFST